MIEKNGLKILIVDDTPANLLVMAKTLENEGYEMRFSEDGASALAIVKKASFDLILLDVMMPKMDGFEVCQHLKADPTTANIPVIFITAKTDVDSIVRGFTVGGVDYVTKPFQVEELRARVGTHLSLRLREQELRQLNATKDKFIGILAHELKIPLGGIKGFITLLDEQFEQFSVADIRENIRLTRDAIENVFALIENLLNWSSLQMGPVVFRPSIFELCEVLTGIIRECEDSAIHKHIALDFQSKGELWVQADVEMVESIVRNLIANAIKFGRKDGLARVLAAEREEDILVTVEDDGSGIAAEDVPKLFRLDTEVKQIGTYGEVGTGMGLILAKGYVDRHGGRIWLESEIEKGTKVFFTLPKARAN
jgi:signal transduction histidine kinase